VWRVASDTRASSLLAPVFNRPSVEAAAPTDEKSGV
jgi:hypothetical protein